MPTGQKNGSSRMIAVRVPNELDVKVQEIAKQNGTSVSQVVIAAIKDYLQKEDAKG